MADYTTHFSTILDVRTAENVDRALVLYAALASEIEADDGTDLNFVLSPERDEPAFAIARRSGSTTATPATPGHVITFVQRCAEAFGLDGRWGFVWGHDCSKPRLDSFGGGAVVIDLGTGRSEAIDVSDWLDDRVAGRVPFGSDVGE